MTTPAITENIDPLRLNVTVDVELDAQAIGAVVGSEGAGIATLGDLIVRAGAGARDAVLTPLLAAGVNLDELVGLSVNVDVTATGGTASAVTATDEG